MHIECRAVMPRVVVELAVAHGEMPQATQRDTRAPPGIVVVENAMLYEDCPGVEHIHSSSRTAIRRAGVEIVAVVQELAICNIAVLLVFHFNASAKSLRLGRV